MPAWSPQGHDLTGQRAIVTGANSGIGLETARVLAQLGAEVILACRNAEKAAVAQAEIEQSAPDATVEVMALDLSSQASVAAFASAFNDQFKSLDLLINNAGVMVPPKTITDDGYELQFATNHLGHFALTGRLLDALRAAPAPRVVTVSSLAHRFGKIDLGNLACEKGYSKWAFYGQSKLANLMFTLELQRRVDAAGVPLKATAAHPGYTSTNLQRSMFGGGVFNALFAQSVPRGAEPTLRAALDPEAEGGAYFGPSGWGEVRGSAVPAKKSARAQDPEQAAALWAASVGITGVDFAALG